MRSILALVALLALVGTSFSVGVSSCINITAPGTYTLSQSISGSPNDASPAGGAVCMKIAAPNVVFDCQGFSINGDHTNDSYGIALNDSATNVTVQNCLVQGYDGGVTLINTNGSFFRNITSYNNTLAGFFITGVNGGNSNFHLFDNDTAFDNPYGFYLVEDTFVNVTNSASYNNTEGFQFIFGTTNNILSGNRVFNNTDAGFNVGPGNNNNTITFNNVSLNPNIGINIESNNDVVANNTVFNNPNMGILVSSSTNTLVQNNTAYGNGDGIRVYIGSSLNNITGNTAHDNTANGFEVEGTNNLFTLNTAYNNPAGFSFEQFSSGNTVVNNTAYSNTGQGFYLPDSTNNLLTGNTAFNNAVAGFEVAFGGNGNTFANNTAFNQTAGSGVYISASNNTVLSDTHLYNNGMDLQVSGSGIVYNSTQTFFDNPAGNMQNFTNLSLGDTLGTGEGYSVSWSAQPSPLPPGMSAFGWKFVNIAPISGSPSIDQATWTWLPSELGPFAEAGLQLWEYHSGWIARNVTPDTLNHRLTLSSIANFSVFAILVNNNVTGVKVDVTPLLPSPGGMTQWQINVTNTGSGPLDPVSVTDQLPSGLRFSASSPAPDSLSPDNLTANWNNVGPLASGASAIIMLNASVDANASNGTYFNNVNVTAIPVNGTAATASDSTPIGIFAPGISVVKTLLNTTLLTLQPIPFSINVTNTGSINLSVDVLDTFESFNVSFNGSSVPPTQVTNSSVLWANYTVIQPGQSSVIYLNLTSINGKDYVNNVTVTGYPPNGNSVSDNSSAPFLVVFPISSGGQPLPPQSLSATFGSNCSGNVVTITSSGPVEGADVTVNGNSAGSTDSSGQVSFQGCGQSLVVRATKSGYQDVVIYPTEIACGQCVVACVNDSGCASDQRCQINTQNASLNQCVPLQCSCGQTADNHQCQGAVWQCGPGCNVCPGGQACNADHVCQPTGCTSNQQCPDNQQCLSPTGAPGSVQVPGSCQNVTGACGYVSNHAFVPYNYTCGPEPGCPSCPAGQNCVAHQCLSNDINCPSTGIVGTSKTCLLTENNTACGPEDNCTAIVTSPDGKNTSVTPDENGNVQVPLSLQGRYVVTLLKNGQVVKQVFVNAVPQGAPTTPPELPSGAAGPDIFTVGWLLVLLLVVIGAVIYWRSRSQNK